MFGRIFLSEGFLFRSLLDCWVEGCVKSASSSSSLVVLPPLSLSLSTTRGYQHSESLFSMASQTLLARPLVAQTSKRPPPHSSSGHHHGPSPTVNLIQASPSLVPPTSQAHQQQQVINKTDPQTTGAHPISNRLSIPGCSHLVSLLNGSKGAAVGEGLLSKYNDVCRWGLKLKGVGQPANREVSLFSTPHSPLNSHRPRIEAL
jgi:hypothetical protein